MCLSAAEYLLVEEALAPRLGEHERAVVGAGLRPVLLGQEAEEVDLGQALRVQVLLQLRCLGLLRRERGLALRVNAIREERRVDTRALEWDARCMSGRS